MESKSKELIDVDIFSRRISPYFTWLESKIESGWSQSENVDANVLKEAKHLAESMRARFILGLTREDFVVEIQRTLDLFDLALDAFPDYAGEVETKVQHFTKGLRTEFGDDVVPNGQVKAAAPKVKKNANGVKSERPKVKKTKKAKKAKKSPAKKEPKKQPKAEQKVEGKEMPTESQEKHDPLTIEEARKETPEQESRDGPIARFVKRLIWGDE